MVNVENKNNWNEKDHEYFDKIIDLETKRKISKVEGSSDFGIMTACFINGEFCLVTEYDITDEMYEALKKA